MEDFSKLKKEELLRELNNKVMELAVTNGTLKGETAKLDQTIGDLETALSEVKSLKAEVKGLNKKLQEQEALINKAEEYKAEFVALKQLKDEAIAAEHSVRKEIKAVVAEKDTEINKLKVELDSRHKEFENSFNKVMAEKQAIAVSFNSLASLFDEYMRAFDDNQNLYKIMARNTESTLELLRVKVNNFNNEGETKK